MGDVLREAQIVCLTLFGLSLAILAGGGALLCRTLITRMRAGSLTFGGAVLRQLGYGAAALATTLVAGLTAYVRYDSVLVENARATGADPGDYISMFEETVHFPALLNDDIVIALVVTAVTVIVLQPDGARRSRSAGS